MTRISRCAHLKPTVEKLFLSGKMPHDVVAVFSELPLKTAKDWHQALVDKGLVPAIESEALATVNNVLQRVSLESEELYECESDINWVKSSCRRIFNQEISSSVQLQALGTFLKAIQLESILKKDEPEIKTEEFDLRPYQEMSAEELSQIYRDKLA